MIAGILGTSTSAASYTAGHWLQVPLLLLVNATMASWYYSKGNKSEEKAWWRRWGPLSLHILGTLLTLYMPLFDKGMLPWGPQGDADLVDPNWIFKASVSPPQILKGGFWHHGPQMAFTAVAGLVCTLGASVWAANQETKKKKRLQDED